MHNKTGNNFCFFCFWPSHIGILACVGLTVYIDVSFYGSHQAHKRFTNINESISLLTRVNDKHFFSHKFSNFLFHLILPILQLGTFNIGVSFLLKSFENWTGDNSQQHIFGSHSLTKLVHIEWFLKEKKRKDKNNAHIHICSKTMLIKIWYRFQGS